MIVFDIETESLPEDELRSVMPPFDEESVAVGNRGPDKAAEYRAEKRVEFERRFIERAALSPTTGRVLAIGYFSPDKNLAKFDIVENEGGNGGPCGEGAVLTRFWKQFYSLHDQGRSAVGVNIVEFDLPFIIRRSWMLGVDVPENVFVGASRRYFSNTFVDLCQVWLCGQKFGSEPASFDALALAFGTAGKPEGVSGADFARLYRAGGADRVKAMDYLESDIRQPAVWANRMGILK